jgi:hypothetical protein
VIISNKAEKYDEPWRLVMYNKDEAGACTPRYVESEYSEEIALYYKQRAEELKRLHSEVLKGNLSPIGFFVKYQHINVKDVAKRVKLRAAIVESHMTFKGFKTARVGELQSYARVFDVSVSDFFDFSFVGDGIAVALTRHHNRLINESVFTAASSRETE